MDESIFDAAGGGEGLLALAAAWHARCLADPVANHPFSHPGQHPEHIARLAAYWGEALGGPPAYSTTMGDHSGVVRMHSGNGEHQELDEHVVGCFIGALDDVGIADERLRAALTAYFRWGIGLMNQHPDGPDDVEDGRAIPQWSWSGAVSD